NLASTLNNLGNRYSEVGRHADIETLWRTVLAEATPSNAALLLLARTAAADPGTPQAIGWVTTALRHADGDRPMLASLHDQARRHRNADPDRFDHAWTAAAGTPPDWLTLDMALLNVAHAWIDTPTYRDEHDFLKAHPELLTPAANSAITEAVLTVSEQTAERYLTLRDNARAHGTAAAYQPLLLAGLAAEFAAADPPTQAAMLAEHRDDLLTDTVRETLAEQADNAADRADAILALAHIGAAEPALDALMHPEKFADLMATIAESPDWTTLDAVAFLARTSAETDEAAATADFYSAVAAACADDLDEAAQTLTQARQLAPDQTATWINQLARIGRRHPAALSLIAVLTTPDQPPGAPA
ncbi:hypothetical protein, partial [Paractinoplanes rishiriensis]|uniref:hypothetical protein n=1 Tax=Paractinoplanes rishiriensis TaxID=1050105 RepID=UPI0019412CE0